MTRRSKDMFDNGEWVFKSPSWTKKTKPIIPRCVGYKCFQCWLCSAIQRENFSGKYFSFQLASISWPLEFSTSPLVWVSVEVEGTFQQEIRVIDPDAIWQFVDRQGGASNLNVLNLVCFFSQISANYIEVFEVQWDPAPNPPFCFDSNLLVVASPGIENWTMPSHCPIAHCQYCCWRRINTVLISKARSFQWRALRESIQFVKFILLSYLTCIEADIHAFYSRQALADIALVTYTCANKWEIQKSAVTFNKRSEVVAFDRLGITIFQSRTWLAFQDYDRWI